MKIVFLFLFFALWCNAQEFIEKYIVDITVHQNGTLDIRENITYNFGKNRKHGIYRDIPLKAVKYLDGFPMDIGLNSFHVYMDDNIVDFTESKVLADSGPNIRLKIGDPHKYISGIHDYTIDYNVAYGISANADSNLDSVRWNAIGTGWNIPIAQATINLYLPKSLSKNNIKFSTYSGKYGSTTTKAAYKWIDRNKIEIQIKNLAPHEGLTFEAAFALGTLEQSSALGFSENIQLWLKKFWHWLLFGIIWLYIHSYWKRHGQNAPVRAIAVQYEPPEDMNILRAGIIYDQFADDKDFSSAIVELAQSGYIRIKDDGDSLKIQNLHKDTTSLCSNQKYLLNNILFFLNSETCRFHKETYDAALAARVKDGFSLINKNLYEWVYKEKYMEKNPQQARRNFLWGIVPVNILFFIIGLFASMDFIVFSEGILIFAIVALTHFAIGLYMTFFKKARNYVEKIVGIIFFAWPPIASITFLPFNQLSLFLFSFLSSFPFLVLISYLYYKNMGAYTQKGALYYAKLEGFKEFIKRVKAEEIKKRLEYDPEFLDKVLPYAMFFGYSNKWIGLYEQIGKTIPVWYDGNHLDSIDNISSTINSATTPPSSSGGMSGGGGSSGGGSGGGGGGSW